MERIHLMVEYMIFSKNSPARVANKNAATENKKEQKSADQSWFVTYIWQ